MLLIAFSINFSGLQYIIKKEGIMEHLVHVIQGKLIRAVQVVADR